MLNKFLYKKIIKGFKDIKSKKNSNFLFNLIKNIQKIDYESYKVMKDESKFSNNIIYNQTINNHLGQTRLNYAIYLFNSLGLNLIYPLNKLWIAELKLSDVKVNVLFSRILFKIYLIYCFFHGLKTFFKISKNISFKKKKHDYLESIYLSEIPDTWIDKNKLMLTPDWCTSNVNLQTKTIYHSSIKNKNIKSDYFKIKYCYSYFTEIYINDFYQFFFKSLKIFFLSLVSFLSGKDDLILLSKRLEKLFFLENKISCKFKKLIFSNSNITNLPNISTLYSENNIDVFFIPNSSNIITFEKYLFHNNSTNYFWDLFYFRKVIVLNKNFKEILMKHSRFLSEKNIYIINYISSISKLFTGKLNNKYYVGIFNTQCFKKYLFLLRGDYENYYKPENLYNFI